MAPPKPQITKIREALKLRLETINGSGSYWNDVRKYVMEGVPDHTKMRRYPCVFVMLNDRTTDGSFIANGAKWSATFTIWGYVQSSTPFEDVEKLEADILRAIRTNSGLGCNALFHMDTSTDYETQEIEREDGRETVALCKIETKAESRETY